MREDYLPSDVKFDIPEQYGFPPVIFEDLDNIEDIKQAISHSLVAIQERDAVAIRLMDEYEKECIRDEYQILLESKKPRLSGELEATIAECKSRIKEAKAKLSAVLTEIDDLVSQVRKGTRKVDLKFGDTFRIPVGEHYLYYTWVNDKFKLAAVRIIPNWDKNDVFNSSKKNTEFFKEQYGIETSELAAPKEEIPIEVVESEVVEYEAEDVENED